MYPWRRIDLVNRHFDHRRTGSVKGGLQRFLEFVEALLGTDGEGAEALKNPPTRQKLVVLHPRQTTEGIDTRLAHPPAK